MGGLMVSCRCCHSAIFSWIEIHQQWPVCLSQWFIILRKMKVDVPSWSDLGPITVATSLYRLWARARARRIMRGPHLALPDPGSFTMWEKMFASLFPSIKKTIPSIDNEMTPYLESSGTRFSKAHHFYRTPKFNIAPENGGWKTTLLLGFGSFSGFQWDPATSMTPGASNGGGGATCVDQLCQC